MTQKQKKEIKLSELYEVKPDLAKTKAEFDYFLYHSVNSIAHRYGIPISTLRYWCYIQEDCWKDIRQNIEDAEFERILKSKREDLKNIMTASAKVILRVLNRIEKNEDNCSIDDAQKVSGILGNIHRVYRLEQDLPTDIVGEALAQKDIREVIRELNEMDEFVDYEVVEPENDGSEKLSH